MVKSTLVAVAAAAVTVYVFGGPSLLDLFWWLRK